MDKLEKHVAELSPAKRALLELRRAKADKKTRVEPPLRRRAGSAPVPLSFAQQRLWLIHQLDPESHLYNVPRAVRMRGPLNMAALERSVNAIIERHEVLRTRFALVDDKPVQVILPSAPQTLEITDISEVSSEIREREAMRLALEEGRKPMDLASGPALRCRVLRLGAEDHALVIVMHHIVSDGWTGGVLFDELGKFYSAFTSGKEPGLAELPVQYADFSLWQREWMQGPVLEQELSYWRAKLEEAPAQLSLPVDRPQADGESSYRGATRSIVLPADLSEGLKALSRQRGATLFTVLLAGLKILLHRWSGQDDITVGAISANRNRIEIENLVGCFVNFLPLRDRIHPGQTAADFLQQVKVTANEAQSHQDCPFEKIIEAINPQRALNVNPLYNVGFQVQNFPEIAFRSTSLEARFLELDPEVAFLDVRFIACENDSGITISCEYKQDLFDASTIQFLLRSYQQVLSRLIADPGARIEEFAVSKELIRQAEAARIRARKETVAIAATFTAEPIERSLRFWLKELGIRADIKFAGYNQVFPALLDSSSLLAKNEAGVNVILVRLEDWAGEATSPDAVRAEVQRNARDFIAAVRTAAQASPVLYFVCVCPMSRKAASESEQHVWLQDAELSIETGLSSASRIQVITSRQLLESYPVTSYDDAYAEKVGHIPYTSDLFTALGTAVARQIHATRREPRKVIAVDYDAMAGGTGFRSGMAGAGRSAFQEFLIAQYDMGILLCLCSKNANDESLPHSEDLLKADHIIASQVSQAPNSQKLRQLEQDLQIPLESFIFISRDPDACAEVRLNCPDVLVLELPESPESASSFLRQVWPLDIATGGVAILGREPSPTIRLNSARVKRIAAQLGTVDQISRVMAEEDRRKSDASGPAPRTPTEEIIAGIWSHLLHIDQVGRTDNFFELGGHSLLATQVIARIRQISQVELPLRAMFETETLGELAALVDAERGSSLEIGSPLVRVPRDAELPLSFGQERLWFLEQMEGPSALYNIPQLFRITGDLNIQALDNSIQELVKRHESLRTTLQMPGDQPVQHIADDLTIPLSLVDLRELASADREAEVLRLVREEAHRPFDLSKGPLLRTLLVRIDDHEYALLINSHHVVSDRWSMGLLSEELAALYSAFSQGKASPLQELSLQYADYAAWQRNWLKTEQARKHSKYWKNRLNGAPPLLELPTDRLRPAVQSTRGGTIMRLLPQELVEKIRIVSRTEGVTLFMTLLAAFQSLLSRYSGQDDIVVGSPIANRTRAELEPLIGFFVNTLAFRTDLSGNPTFRELLSRVREISLGAYAHQDLPFEKLVEELQPERSLSHNPVFQVLFALQNARMGPLELPGLQLTRVPLYTDTSMFDMSWFAIEVPDGLVVRAEYSTDLFDEATIAQALEHFQRLLEAVVQEPDAHLLEIPLLSDSERHRILVEFNDTREHFPEGLCIHQIFEAQAERTPGSTAVIDGDRRVSYGELNARANQLAHFLRKQGVGPEMLVAICVERSVEMLVGILGILKAGGAYVPLDPAYPKERLKYILEDAKAPIVLTQGSLVSELPQHEARRVCLDADWPEIAQQPDNNPEVTLSDKNLGYVLFTSGSTGRPKGVAIEHRSAATFLQWAQTVFTPEDLLGVLFSTSVCFDLSVFEMFVPLSVGGQVIIAQNALYLPSLAAKHEVTLINTVPSAMAELLRMNAVPESVSTVNLAGEALPGTLVEQIYSSTSVSKVFNLYGPTEDTTYSTYTLVPRGATVTIGRPLANTQAYVLDVARSPVPIGVVGELYLAGAGLARGYFGRPDLTAERFLPNPFSLEPGERMYRTGDLCRWLADGNLQYLGRIDNQVKVRGFRIELSEIDAALTRCDAVRQSVTVVREDQPGQKILVAYIVPTSHPAPSSEELRNTLKASLPDFMIPAAFVTLEALPLTPNGKVDRKALPAPDFTLQTNPYVGPRTPTEEKVAAIWAEVLRIPKVGVEDDFFALGGHSLLATQIISRLRNMFGVDLPLRTMFETPTVAGLSGRLVSTQQLDARRQLPALRRVPREHPFAASFAQERLWFLDQLEPNNPLYNLACTLRADFAIDVPVLERCLNTIVERHEALRTAFVAKDGRPIQAITPSVNVTVPLLDLSNLPHGEREAEAQRLIFEAAQQPFDLARGPLLRALAVRVGTDEYLLLLNIHHIVSDRWSIGVLLHELAALYDAYSNGKPSPLPDLAVQYADFAAWQREYLQGSVFEEQLAFWKEHLRGAPPVLELPTDRPRPAVETFHGAVARIDFPKGLTAKLNALSRSQGVTLFMTLLAGFTALLSRYSGQDDIVLGLPIASRSHPEIEPLIGLFANTLPVRTKLSGNPSFRELLARTSETALAAYAHQDMPFEKLVEELQPERSLSHNPLVQVFFILQNAPLELLQLGGLKLRHVETDTKTAKGDMFVSLVEKPEGLRAAVEYNTDLFDPATIQRMLRHYQVLLEAAADNCSTCISDLPLLGAGERQQILTDWNATQFDYPRDLCLHEVFEAQAERTPGAVACIYEDRELTYQQLNERANQLARFLKKRGAGPGKRIAIFVERSLDMMVGLLGIQKTGAAYVPLDPAYPAERIRLILEEANAPVLVTQESLRAARAEQEGVLVCLDSDWHLIAQESTSNLNCEATPDDLVYVIFTSGSTGRPKGVQVPHRAVVNLLHFMAAELRMGPGDVMPALASFAFDMCIPELYLPLVTGGTVVVGHRTMAADGEELAALLKRTGATVIHATPTTWNLLLEAGFAGKGLKRVIGAEPLPRELCIRLLEADPSLYNFYGPTETTVWSAFHHFRSKDEPVVVGRPLANTQIYILDRNLQPVPVGVPGEIHIAGDGVAHGYLNRPELTAEKFIPDPFSRNPNARMYKTGDLGRFLPDGRIEFQGRADNQVKVRGYRIELGEIEAVLSKHPAVNESVVVVREDVPGNKRLVAYVVSGNTATQAQELRAWVRQHLPEYMVPVAFVGMDRLPLTPNGKVDRRNLPAPESTRAELDRRSSPWKTPLEGVIADIWADVLQIDAIGTDDDFFELGGHSLLATQAISRIREAVRFEVPLRVLFEAPTVARLAERVSALQQERHGPPVPCIMPTRRDQRLPLSFAQQRLWFLDQLEPNNPIYNVPYIARVRGELDVEILQRTINEIVSRHETLRTTFPTIDDEPVQVIAPAMEIALAKVDLTSVPEWAREDEARKLAMEELMRPFNLSTGPLLRASVLRLAADDHVLIVNTHHIISDRWSLGVLSEELAAVYEAFLRKCPSPLPALPIQYADYSVWQREVLSGTRLESQLAYWKKQLEGAPPVLNLPTDRPRQALANFWGGVQTRTLSLDLAADLRRISRAHRVTFFMTLITAFQAVLARWSRQEDVVIGTDLANRTRMETEKLIGFFVNVLPIRARFNGNPRFDEFLEHMREVLLGAFAHQDVPFDKLVEELRPERTLTHNPLVQVLFVMQNTPQPVREFGGLKLSPLGVSSTSRFDLVLFVNDPDGAASITWMYNPHLFDESTIVRIANLYEVVLQTVARDPQVTMSAIFEALAESEREQRQRERMEFEQASARKLKSMRRKAVSTD